MTPAAVDLLPALYVVGVIALICLATLVFCWVTQDDAGNDYGPY
jgi:hypothetical protein